MAKLTEIEGIGPVFADKLKEAGIGSIESFLKYCCDPKGRKDIEAKTGIDHSRILRFVNHADLMRIKGVGGEYSELLEAAGVDTVPELAQRNAANLHAKMVETNASKKLVRQMAGASQVASWVSQAKQLSKVVTH
jgi:predicted flap endonuclease-1-like 5' DNA nuclease